MNLYQPIISGSLEVSGSVTINGTLRVLSGSILGTASIAENSLLLGGLNSGSFQSTSSFSSFSGSLSTRLVTDEGNIATNTAASASFAAQSASLSTRLTTDESNFTSLSSSFATTSGSLSTRVTNLESTSSTVSSSFATTSGSIAGRVTLIEGQYATTGSNNFTKPQQISDVSNAISFTSTASLYTDGGLRVKGSSFISGTAYFNDVVVYGTSSIEYITSSQLAIGTNIITLNTDTPSIRFGGISVFDSGSNNLSTGSLFWDSEKDKWIYSNPSASTYDGGMLISGPRNTSGLGNEVGTTSCALMMGQGGDHITSSAIFSYGNATCFYGQSFISSSGAACFGGNASIAGNLGVGISTPSQLVDVYKTSNDAIVKVSTCAAGAYFAADSQGTDGYYGLVLQNNGTDRWLIGGYATTDFTLNTARTGGSEWLRISRSNGLACFASTVCTPQTSLLCNANTGYTSIKICNPNPGSSAFSQISFFNDTTNQAGFFYNSSTRSVDGGVCSFSMYNDSATGNIRIRTGGSIVLATGAPATDRLTINSSGVACFASQVCAVNAVLTSGGTERYLQLAGYNNAYATIRSNVGFNTSYNNLSLLLNVNSNESGQGNSSLPSWAINLGGNEGDQDTFIVSRSAAGSYSFSNLLKLNSTGVGCFAGQVCSPLLTSTCLILAGSGYFPAKMISMGGAEFSRYNTHIGTRLIAGSQIAMVIGTRSNNVDYDDTLNIYNGNVGVGTCSPANKLTLSNNGNSVVAFRINDTNANSSFLSLNASNADSAIIAGGTSAIPFDIYTGGSVRIRVNGNGITCFACQICTPSVGIGIGATTSPLQVFGGGASTMLQTGTQRYTLFGKYIQSYAGAAVNIPLLVACGMANTGILVKAYIYGTNAVGSQRYEDAGYAGIYYIGGGLQGSNAAVTTICNLGGVGHTVGVLYWGNTASNPVLYYCQGNNGYIGESIDLYVTIRDSANVYFYPDQIVCG